MANVQITEELFIDLVRWHLLNTHDDATADRIAAGLQAKVDRLALRALYTQSKTAPSAEERERARQDYLDERGILHDFRWPRNT